MKKGLTLVEVIVVICILAIVAGGFALVRKEVSNAPLTKRETERRLIQLYNAADEVGKDVSLPLSQRYCAIAIAMEVHNARYGFESESILPCFYVGEIKFRGQRNEREIPIGIEATEKGIALEIKSPDEVHFDDIQVIEKAWMELRFRARTQNADKKESIRPLNTLEAFR